MSCENATKFPGVLGGSCDGLMLREDESFGLGGEERTP